MKACSLFLPTDNCEQLAQVIKKSFPEFNVELSDSSADWHQAKIWKKTGWFSKASILINVRSFKQPDEFVPMLQGMMNFVGQVPAQNQQVKFKLMTKIQNTKAALGVVADSGLEVFEEGLFQVIKNLDGFAFNDGTNWVSPSKQLILNTTGQSEVTDLNVPDAHVQLGQADSELSETLYPSQMERKKRNIAFLNAKNVPTIEHLPCIEADEEVELRTKEEIVKRTIAVAIAAVKGEGLEMEIVNSVIHQFNAMPFFSPEEKDFIQNTNVTDADRAKFSWRYECLWVLLWSMGYIEQLDFPEGICDVAKAVGFIQAANSYENMLASAKLRAKSEILDEADKIYRLNWACVNARMKQQAAPANLEAGVVYERHFALNWLINYQGQDWDFVSADT
jgi:Domain of unknown function (DUF4272)